jgi:hypothetical protein
MHQAAGGQLTHLSRTHEQHSFAVQGAEDFARQIHGDGSDGNRRNADAGLVSDLARDGKSPLQQRIEIAVHPTHRARNGIGFFHLAENLRLAHDQRVQTGGNAKDMPHHFRSAIFVQIRTECAWVQSEIVVDKLQQVGLGGFLIREKLDAIAGGENHPLAHAGHSKQGLCRLLQARRRDGEPFPYRKRRGFVVDANEDEVHGAANRCTVLNWFAAHTVSATRNTSEDK